MTRNGLHARYLAVRPDSLELAEARNGRNDRISAGGNDDVLRGVEHAVDLDHACTRELAGPAQQVDALGGEPALLAGVGVVRHHEVAPGQRLLDIDLCGRGSLARAMDRLAGPEQRLGRDARPVGALAADELALDKGDPQAALGEYAGAVLAGRAGAEDDDVVVAVHRGAAFVPTVAFVLRTSVLLTVCLQSLRGGWRERRASRGASRQ